VVTAGDYEIELALACPPTDAGSRLRIIVGKESIDAIVTAAPAPEIALPHRDEAGKSRCRNREWTTLKAGTLKLPKGPAQLTLEALTMPGTQVMELKHVKLNLRSSQ
jgi:arylsulfatase A